MIGRWSGGRWLADRWLSALGLCRLKDASLWKMVDDADGLSLWVLVKSIESGIGAHEKGMRDGWLYGNEMKDDFDCDI